MAGQPWQYRVAVIGAGPAGLFAARELVTQGVQVVLLNRDIKPGGLAEYGIYPDKYKIKNGLRLEFQQIWSLEGLTCCCNLTVGTAGDLTLDQLRRLGFQALLVTVGAQATKWLGLPGEDLPGVYHAKDLVYHYNRLPPFSQVRFNLGPRVAIVGVGNVMADIAHYLIQHCGVTEVTALARRGPAEVKFDKKELERIAAHLDLGAFDAEIDRCAGLMRSLGQDPEAARDFVHAAVAAAGPPAPPTCPAPAQAAGPARFRLQFLVSPVAIHASPARRVGSLELEDNTLVASAGETQARPLGTHHQLEVDTVIFAIGDRVDAGLGLPVQGAEFIKNQAPRFPVDNQSYEVFDPAAQQPIADVFVAGWARHASQGLVGIARRDGVNGARAVLQYLHTRPPQLPLPPLDEALAVQGKRLVTRDDLIRLMDAEAAEAARLGLPEFKFDTNEAMLEVIWRSATKPDSPPI